jgi:hypothetical protein
MVVVDAGVVERVAHRQLGGEEIGITGASTQQP